MLKFEAKTVDAEDIAPGLLPQSWQGPVFVLSFVGFLFAALALAPSFLSWPALVILAFLSARLLALDLTHMVLLNLYTIPFGLVGLACSFWAPELSLTTSITGVLFGIGFPVLFNWGMAKFTGRESGLGGGDVKLMAACGAWLGVHNFLLMLPLACLFTLFISLLPRKVEEIPFGPGLLFGFWVVFLAQTWVQNSAQELVSFLF